MNSLEPPFCGMTSTATFSSVWWCWVLHKQVFFMQGMWLPASRVRNWRLNTQTPIHWFPSCDINFLFASTATISSELVLVAVWVHQNSRLCSKVNIVKLLGESQYTPPFGDDVLHLLAEFVGHTPHWYAFLHHQQLSHGVVGHLEQHLLGPGQEPQLHHLLVSILHGVVGVGGEDQLPGEVLQLTYCKCSAQFSPKCQNYNKHCQ